MPWDRYHASQPGSGRCWRLQQSLELLTLQAQQGGAEQGQEGWVRLPGDGDGTGDAAGADATAGHGEAVRVLPGFPGRPGC